MREMIVDSVIWYAGAVVVFAAITAALAFLAGCSYWFSEAIGRHLLRAFRFETVSYWIHRMEREGLTLPQTEYRRMVEERKPKNVQDFLELDRLENERWSKEHMGDIE